MDVEMTNWKSPEKEVEKFLADVCTVIDLPGGLNFNYGGPKNKTGTKYSNMHCVETLGFTKSDIVAVLKNLTSDDYVHTIIYSNGKRFFVFCKYIQISQVYIKMRIRENNDGRIVICVSFHFAEHEINTFPYKRRKK